MVSGNRFISANKAAERLFACARDEILKSGPQQFYAAEQPDGHPVPQSFAEHNDRALAGEEITYERRILNARGEDRLCRVTLVRLPSASPRLLRASFVDITEQKASERVLRRLNRTLLTLSRGNEVLVHAASEQQLLSAMCHVLVDTGGYRMAWVGTAEHDAAKSVTPVASAGDTGDYLEKARITWADEPRGGGLIGRAIRSGEPANCQDIAADPGMAPWLEEAKRHGFASSIALPLMDQSGVFAALTLYSDERGSFDADELRLLQELAEDLAFGIRSLREHAEHEALNQRWRASLEATVGAIANTVEMRDPYTSGHQQRVARLAVAMAREMGLPEHQIEGLYLAGIIHDVGKIDIPSDILNKPGKLSKLQFQLIQGHAQSGFDIVKGVDFPWPIAQMILQHHERLDGSGYPQGLKGEAILPEAQILAVADVVEAMMSHRPYRPALGIEAALAEIENGSGRVFDPAAVAACVTLFRDKRFTF
jgi:PAS domain S-box-containing protein